MEVCKRCIVPDSMPHVTFEDGVCNICRNHDLYPGIGTNVLGEDKLVEVIASKKSSKYDCAVPISGGKDSSYVLFRVVRKLGLKPLALFFDNGFTADAAKQNVQRICRALRVDLVIGEASEFRRKLVREALYVSNGLGRFVKVCGNCENNLRTFVINAATQRNIPFIIWGSTDFEDSSSTVLNSEAASFRQSFGALGNTYAKFKRQFSLLEPLLSRGSLRKIAATIFHSFRYIYYFVRDNIETKAPEGMKRFSPFLEVSFEGKGVKTLYFYDYVKYDPYTQIDILMKSIDWRAPSGKEAKMDCKLSCFTDHEHLQRTGITHVGFKLSALVRNGLLSREQALEKESSLKQNLASECKEVADELGVDIRDVDGVVEMSRASR